MATATRNPPRSVESTGIATPQSTLAAVLLVISLTNAGAAAQSPDVPGMVQVTVEVELTCPSCALGLERRLGRVSGVAGVEVRPADGRILLTVESGRHVDLDAVRDTVRNVGFIPDGVEVVAVGRLTDANGAPALALSPDFALPLATGEPTAALVSAGGDRLLTVSGHWRGPPGGPGQLQVEWFEAR